METKIVIGGIVSSKDVNEEILSELVSTGKVYQSASTRYHMLIARLKGRDVRFADHRTYLFNLAKEAGLWESKEDLRRAEVLDLEWYHAINLFLGWVSRNFAGSYEKLSKKAGTPARQKAAKEKEGKVVTRQGRKLTKKRLESASTDRESKEALFSYIVENLGDIVAELVANDETKRALIDALESAGIR